MGHCMIVRRSEHMGYPDLCRSCMGEGESVQCLLCDCAALQGNILQCVRAGFANNKMKLYSNTVSFCEGFIKT